MTESIDRDAWMLQLTRSVRHHKASALFLDGVAKRLAVGELEYGNASFDLPIDTIVREILDETLDRAGWCYVLERACRKQADAEACTLKRREELLALAESARTVAVSAFEAFAHDREMFCQPVTHAALDERDGAWNA